MHRIAVGALLVLAAVLLWWSSSGAAPLEVPDSRTAATVEPTAHAATVEDPAARRDASSPTPSPALPIFVFPSLPSLVTSLEISGLVVDIDGRPVPDVTVTFEGRPFDPPAKTDASGRFASRRPAAMGNLDIDDPRYVALLRPVLFDGDKVHADLTLVVAPCVAVRGVIVDTEGRPIGDASIRANCGVDLRASIARVFDRDLDVRPETQSDAAGSFALLQAPGGAHASIDIEARGYESSHVDLADALTRHRFELRRRAEGDELRGIVVDEEGEPVGRAHVTMHDLTTVTSADGVFIVPLWKVGDPGNGVSPTLVIRSSGRLAVYIGAGDNAWRSRRAWPADLRITIGSEGEGISGRVLHGDGTPVEQPSVIFESPGPEQVSGTLSDAPDGWETEVAIGSGEPGAFATPRVAPGRYRLRVMDPISLEMTITDPIATGSHEVAIRLPAVDRWPPLHGVVVDRNGAAVPGADWTVERSDPAPGRTEAVQGFWHNATPNGVIDHPPLSREVTTLCVKAAGMAEWRRFAIADLLPRLADFRVVVPVGRRARIELDGTWQDATRAQLVDASGSHSAVVITQGDTAIGTPNIPLTQGRSQTFVALDDCTEMLLYRGKEMVRRVPIRLEAIEMNVLRP
ncbi:MAG: carboxypeptidase-like regulatory domain-containing protein [Planctomycetota bacterium]